MATNLAIAVLAATMIWLVGLGPFLLVQLPITLLAGSIGVWLFYIQHQFEDTFWARDEGWNFHDAALHGSSHYDLPSVLRWFTANIRVHHVRHLCSRIPYYRLPRVLRDHPELAAVGRLTLLKSSPLRAHGSLGRKEAAAHFISPDAYSRVGDEQKDGRRSKSVIVIFRVVVTPQRKTRPSTGRRRPAFQYFWHRIVTPYPMGNPAHAAGRGRAILLRGPHAHGRILSKQYTNARRPRLNGDERFVKMDPQSAFARAPFPKS